MKNFIFGITLLSSLSAFSNPIQLNSGESLNVQAVNLSCGSNMFAKLSVVGNRVSTENVISTQVTVTSECSPRICYVNHFSGFRYSLHIDSEIGKKELVSKDLSKSDAISQAKNLQLKNECLKIVKSGVNLYL